MSCRTTTWYAPWRCPVPCAAQRLTGGVPFQIMAMDGHNIANDGTVAFRNSERIAFRHLVTRKYLGDSSSLTVLRGGKKLELTAGIMDLPPLVPQTLCVRRVLGVTVCFKCSCGWALLGRDQVQWQAELLRPRRHGTCGICVPSG